jgi:hypothetical protein
MTPINNVNVLKKLNNNVNVINDIVNLKSRTETQVDTIADDLIKKLGVDTSFRPFYCKVGWKLSDATIYNNLEIALKGKSPAKYFTWLCKRQGI